MLSKRERELLRRLGAQGGRAAAKNMSKQARIERARRGAAAANAKRRERHGKIV
jgi:hypothetical protein